MGAGPWTSEARRATRVNVVKLNLLGYLRCPECRAALRLSDRDAKVEASAAGLEIIDGTVACTSCTSRYAITEGVPRLHMVAYPDETRLRTASSFGYLWIKSTPGHEVYDANVYHYAKMEQSLSLPAPTGLVLDAGCGDGIDLANQSQREGVEAIGVELSDGGCRTSYARTRDLKRAHIVEADLCRLPFA